MLKILSFILLSISIVSCNSTLEETKPIDQSTIQSPEQNFTFSGIENVIAISDTRITARFFPAQGGSGQFRYQMLDEGGAVLTAENGANLTADSNGMLHLTHVGYEASTVHRVMIRAINTTDNIPDKNSKYLTVTLLPDLYPEFNGLTRCESFPGGGGQSKMNLNWQQGRIYPGSLGVGFLPHSVFAYNIYYCEKAHGTDCLLTDNANRNFISIADRTAESATVAGLSPNTEYYFRVTALSEGVNGDPATRLEEGNIEFDECKTQVASGPIVFNGITSVTIPNNENGVNQAIVEWAQATGGFTAYQVYYHPVVNEHAIFNINDPNIQTISVIDTNQTSLELVGLDSFTYHAFSVKACADLIADPSCTNGNDGSGAFIVKDTKPSIANFTGIAGTRNDPANPSNVFLDFTSADLGAGGIFDEYRVIISDGTNDYDITDSSATNTLGDLYPSAPATYHTLYLEGFAKTNIASTEAKINGLQTHVIYQADVQAWVDRTSPLPISGGNIVMAYGSTGTVPRTISNNDNTPPTITSMTVTPTSGVVRASETITFVVTYDENLAIAGTTQSVPFVIGGVTRNAVMTSNTLQTITFQYTATSPDNDLDGLEFLPATSIALNGGNISDLSGNNAVLNFGTVAPNISPITVDTIPPSAVTNVVFTENWISTTSSNQRASWSNPLTDFDHAEVGIGAAGSGIDNAMSFVNASGGNIHNFPNLNSSLVQCSQEYEVVVRAVDGAGLTSPNVASVAKFKFDITPPPTTAVAFGPATTSNVFHANEVTWNAVNDTCESSHYEIAIGRDADASGSVTGSEVNTVLDWTVVPGGTGVNSYQAQSGVDGMNFTLNATDNFAVSIRAIDAAGNPAIAATSPNFIVDIAGPSEPTGLGISSNWISGTFPMNSPAVNWTNPTDADFDHIKIALGSTPGSDNIKTDLSIGTFTSYTWTGLVASDLTECNKNFPRITAYDDIGNPSVQATHPSTYFVLDNTAPLILGGGDIDISAGGEDISTNTAPLANFSFSSQDNCSSVDSLDYYEMAIGYDADSDGNLTGAELVNTLAWTEVPGGASANSYQAVSGTDGMFFNFVAGRDYFISLKLFDKAGNESNILTASQSFSFVLDNTRPEVEITTPVYNPTTPNAVTNNPIPVVFTFSEDVTGFDVNDITVANGTAGNFVAQSATVYTADITPTDFGRVNIDVHAGVAQDGASNPNNPATQLSLIYASNNKMTTIWNVTAGQTITLPLRSGFTYDFFVDWGDGSAPQEVTAWNHANRSHTFTTAGTYTITCAGKMGAWFFAGSGSRSAITSVTNLGEMGWRNFHRAFHGANNLLSFTSGNTDTSQVTDMSQMFRDTTSMTTVNTDSTTGWSTESVTSMYLMFYRALLLTNPNVDDWNVSNVQNFQQMFDHASVVTPNTANWNTSSATNMHYMFRRAFQANPDVSNWDVSNVTGMYAMFENADSATPNTTNWNTGNVANMGNMFYHAALANPDTSNWDTSNVTSMSQMFREADSANPDTSNWNTGKVTSMSFMFYHADAANPNTAGWDTSRVTNMHGMFRSCPNCNPVTTTSGNIWNTANVTNMAEMFRFTPLANPNTTGWNTGKVTLMYHMFEGASVANPDVSNWDVSRVTNMRAMFYNAPQATLTVGTGTTNWTTSALTNTGYMFRNASMANPDVSNWDMSRVTTMDFMFTNADAATLTTGTGTTNWNTGNVTNMYYAFAQTELANPDTSNWDTSSVINFAAMFHATEVANPNTTCWQTHNATNMTSMFHTAQAANPVTTTGGCSNANVWNTGNVTSMSHMFYNSPVANPDTGGWDTSKVTNMRSMFHRALAANPNTTNWNTGNVTNMIYTFREANSANPDVSNWNTSNVTNIYYMFYNSPLANPNFSSWDFGKVTQMSGAFTHLPAFTNAHYTILLDRIHDTRTATTHKHLDVYRPGTYPQYQGVPTTNRTNLLNDSWFIRDLAP